jgi:hypothetical protein
MNHKIQKWFTGPMQLRLLTTTALARVMALNQYLKHSPDYPINQGETL